MSENKSRFNPWIPIVILGLATLLFSFYSLQLQTELLEAEKKIQGLETELTSCKNEAETQRAIAEVLKADLDKMKAIAEANKKEAERQYERAQKKSK